MIVSQALYERWSMVKTLSEQMLEHAEQHAWGEITELDNKRRHILEEIFSAPVPDALADLVRAEIQYIQQLDKQVLAAVNAEKNVLVSNIAAVIKGRKVSAAYLDNT